MYNYIIVDDERHCRESLQHLIGQHCPALALSASCESVDATKEVLNAHKIDLVFLDIEMPNKNGFQLLREVEEINFQVIFTTAYDEFAIDAFRTSAIDYLLKPIDPEELKQAVEKFLENEEKSLTQDKLMDIYEIMRRDLSYRKVAIPTMEGLEFFELDDIIRCQAEGNYTKLFMNSGSLLISKTLKQVTELINSEQFVRPHNAHLVNMKYIKKYLKGVGGQLVLDDGSIVPVSRYRKKDLKL